MFPNHGSAEHRQGFCESPGVNKWIKSLKFGEKFRTSFEISREVLSGNWQHCKFAVIQFLNCATRYQICSGFYTFTLLEVPRDVNNYFRGPFMEEKRVGKQCYS